MNIGVNVRFLLKGKLEGIGWFTHEIMQRIVINNPQHHFYFFFDRPYDTQYVFAYNVIPIVLSPPARHPLLWFWWYEVAVKRAIKKYKIDCFISPDGFCSLSSTIPQLLVIHDLAFEHYPEHLPFKFRYYLKKFTPQYAQKATRIISVSNYSKQDLIKTYNTPPEKIDVIYNGAHPLYQPLSNIEKEEIKTNFAQGCEYFVFAGALHPRKNILNLINAFHLFKKKQRSNMKLLIIGRYAWHSEPIKKAILTNPSKEDIIHYEYMHVDKLSKIIGAAYAMVYVSLFEGFGIPILEAMQCQVPSIVSNTTSMPEVAGNTALFVDPTDVNDIAEKMCTLYKDENVRNQLKQNCSAQAAQFNWDKSAVEFWQSVLAACKSQNTLKK